MIAKKSKRPKKPNNLYNDKPIIIIGEKMSVKIAKSVSPIKINNKLIVNITAIIEEILFCLNGSISFLLINIFHRSEIIQIEKLPKIKPI